MANMDNDAYSLFLKQDKILKQNQAANINRQLPQENQMGLNELNIADMQQENTNGSRIGDNYLEKALDFIAKQNQLNMNIHLDKSSDKE